MGKVEGAWWDVPLPQCPDCGDDVVWYEAGYVPGTRKCVGLPIGGRPTTLMDSRVPQPEDYQPTVRDRIVELTTERNTCSDDRVDEIDIEALKLLLPWTKLAYENDGGCGSMFSVQCDAGRVHLRRERMH